MQKKHFLLPILVLLILVCTMTAVSAAEEDFPVLVPESQSQSFEAYCAALPVVEMEAANPYTEAVPVNLMAGVDVEEPISEEEVAPITEDHVYGVVLFAIPEDSELSDVADALLALGVYNAEPVLVINGEPLVLDGLIWYRAECTGNLETVIPAMLEIEGISSAEPEYLYETEAKGLPSQQERKQNWAFNKLLLNNSSKMWWSDILGYSDAPGAGTVVAVIDTGVDYTHEDLAANMWVNYAEKNGVAGQDDDGNGYVDDIYGANVTAKGIKSREGDPMDDNGHGTHVAGIIGMASNNTGGVGIAYGAKIMAVKAGQATGSFSSTDIAKAITYAHSMGADVINMSFGGPGRSNLVEAALQNAFTDCVLVAAAGNDGLPTTDALAYGFITAEDIYPAGYDYVIGVMATDSAGNMASFSNFDFINNGGTAEYEVTAPGVAIYSTLPGDRYASWNGTSMAAPMVSAAAAILRSHYTDTDLYSSRYIMGQIASATEEYTSYIDQLGYGHLYTALNIYDACTVLPKPNLSVKETFILDNVSDEYPVNDGDRTADAGETLALGITVRNQWGMTSDITVTADAETNGIPHPDVTFLIDEVTLDPAGTFGEVNNGYVFEDSLLTDVTLPIVFSLDPDTPNDSEITVNLTVTAKNGADPDDETVYTAKEEFTFRVVRGTTISGQLQEDTTLTSDYYWIIEDTLFVPEGITLTVEPGTQIQFYASDGDSLYAETAMAGIINSGTLNMIGTEDDPISCFPGKGFEKYCVEIGGEGEETLQYCEIINPRLGYAGYTPSEDEKMKKKVEIVDHCRLMQNTQSCYYRYLDNGQVRDGYEFDVRLEIEALSDSVLSGFGCVHPSNNLPLLLQTVNSCLIHDSSVVLQSFSGSKINGSNNVFTGARRMDLPRKDLQINGSFIRPVPIADPLKYTDTVYSFGDSRYVFLNALKDEANRDLALAYAEELGGTLICLNSEEEELFLQEMMEDYSGWEFGWDEQSNNDKQYQHVMLGRFYDEDLQSFVWQDGNSYEGYLTPHKSSDVPFKDNPYIWYRHTSKGYFQIGNSRGRYESCYFILELPATMTDAEIMEKLKNFDYEQWLFDYYGPDITNSAILNPVLNQSPSTWAVFKAGSYDPAISCYNFTGNYWGTENEDLIDLMINDADDYAGRLGDIVEDPILTLDDDLSDIYPFVTSIQVRDTDGNLVKSVSPGFTYTVQVFFNRDMDPEVQPSVTYGPADPFTDFRVTGAWADDREWVGTMTVSPIMIGGTMYFRTSGGAAADDGWLVCGTDVLRFSFDVSSVGAQAMLLQAEGKAGKVDLSWIQNDYELFAGYNIYRSLSPDKGFEKLNDTMVVGEGYADFDVEPGVTYYYYFKVVNTEGVEESNQSNIASAAPLDSIPPTVDHTIVTAAQANNDVTISVKATDNIDVTKVTLYYRVYGTEEYKTKNMVENAADLYVARIPASAVTGAGVEYYIVAEDGENEAYSGTAQHPHIIAVDDNPYISGILPAKVDLAGGVTVSILGGNFREGLTLKVGETEIAEYSVVSTDQINFVAPAKALGSYAVTLTTAEGITVSSPTALAYTDADGIAQIPTDMDMVSGIEYTIPLYVSVDSEMISFHAELDLSVSGFSSVKVEKADSADAFTLEQYYDRTKGTMVIGCISTADFNPGADEPLLLIKVTPTSVTSDKEMDITLHDVSVNGAEIEDVISGRAVVRPNFSLTAKVTYFAEGNAAVPNVTVTAAGVSGVTDAAGTVTLTGISKANVTVIASKLLSAPSSITAYDASLVLQSSVGKITLTDHQKIAADVDGNGKVNEYDAALILQRSVKQINSFPSNKTWIFNPASITKVLTSGLNQVEFTAVYLGDVDGSWAGDQE